jgi:UDP-3-O-[3-hydroxymyristoyl] glucosamine N-acyltransferase
LTYVYDDEQGVSYPLTPASLIYRRRIATTPNESHYEIVSTNKSLTRRAKYQARVLNNFTDQWKKEYFLNIRESSRVQNNSSNVVKAGDIVILKNEKTSRIYWKLAKVENLLRSKDEVIRSAEVRVLSNDNKKTVVLRRPIQHLIPLEVQDTSEIQDTSEVQDRSEIQDTSEVQDTSEIQSTSEVQDTSEIQDTSEVQDASEVQDTSEVQDASEVQDTVEIQDICEVQDASEIQDTGEVQDTGKVQRQYDTRPRRIAAVNG